MKFVLVPGAGGLAWYWHRVVPELHNAGHEAVAVDLPAADPTAGLAEYRDAIAAAIDEGEPVVIVAQSMAGFSAPLVCDGRNVRLLVLVNAMVPRPGESMNEWWENTRFGEARAELAARLGWAHTELDAERDFFNDVPPEIKAEAFAAGPPVQSEKPMSEPWPLPAWPAVPTRFLQGRDDQFFSAAFQRRVVSERIGVTPDEMPGGHLMALGRPVELAAHLIRYAGAI